MQRWYAFTIAVVLLSGSLISPSVAAERDSGHQATALERPGPTSARCNNTLGAYPPPPNPRKGPAPSLSGRLDLGVPYSSGVIRVRIACGKTIGEIMSRHRVPGRAQNWSPPPFDAGDRRSGIDRSYRIEVQPGDESYWVQRLHPYAEDFDWVQLDWQFGFSATLTPNDPQFTSWPQSNLTRAGFPSAWDKTVGSSNVVIAVIDSGLRATHEDAGQWKQKKGYDYVRNIEVLPGQSIDSGCAGGHGTHVATIAAGDTNNGKGIAGAGFNSGILPMRAISGDANGNCTVWRSQTRDWPIRWSRLNGAHIVNMSYKFNGPDPDEEAVMAESWSSGVTPVAAAANDNTDYNAGGRRYPCAYLYVVCVGANNNSGVRCGNSGFGSSWVDFSAPAQNARGAGSASNTAYIYDTCATSYATPLVSGAMALLRSLGKGPQAQYDALAYTA